MENNTEGTKQTQEEAEEKESCTSEHLSDNQINDSNGGDRSPALASTEIEQQEAALDAAENKKKTATKYVELDKNCRWVSTREEYNDQNTS